jgi:hypothetical protein
MFRRLPHPRLRLLPALWALWWMPGMMVYIIIAGIFRGSDLGEIAKLLLGFLMEFFTFHFWRDIWRNIFSILILISPITIFLGTAHYLILRQMGKRSGESLGKWEWRGLVGILIVVLTLGILGFQQIRKERWQRETWGERLDMYEQLAMNGDYDEMVRRMEKDCERFIRAKEKLDGDIFVHSCNHGYSYLWNRLYYTWDSTIRLAPLGVLACLEDVRHDARSDGLGGFGPWKPISEKVAQSKTPILRALGCYLIDDYNSFAETAYALAETDPDAIPLAAKASVTDPDSSRGRRKSLEYLNLALNTKPDSKITTTRCVDIIDSLGVGQSDETTKDKLLTMPWVHELDVFHQRALGLREE